MPGVGGKKYPYTVSGLQRAEAEAVRTGNPVKSDQSVYGPSNMKSRATHKRRKAPRPYKTNRNL